MVTAVDQRRGSRSKSSKPEDAAGKDRQVHAGDHQQMKGTGAFKADAGLVIQVSAVAEDHGAQHARVGVVEEQPFGEPRG